MRTLPKLKTKRLVLLVPGPADAGAMTRYVIENREHLGPWEPVRPADYYTETFWRGVLETGVNDAREGRSVRFALFAKGDEHGEVLGLCTFSNVVRGSFQAAHLGYGLDHRHVGKGLMEEALRAAIRYAFDDLRLHRVMANYMPTNERSGRVLRRLGFTVEGYARDYLRIAGAWEDHVLTSFTNPEWGSDS